MVTLGVTVVIRCESFDSYYLIKITDEPHTINNTVTDKYGHTFVPGDTVVEGHYLEVKKRSKSGTKYYVDYSKSCIISTLCISGICPELEETDGVLVVNNIYT